MPMDESRGSTYQFFYPASPRVRQGKISRAEHDLGSSPDELRKTFDFATYPQFKEFNGLENGWWKHGQEEFVHVHMFSLEYIPIILQVPLAVSSFVNFDRCFFASDSLLFDDIR